MTLGPQGDSFRFCCGELGRVDLALEVARRFLDDELRVAATNRTVEILREVAAAYPCSSDGVAHEWRFPGLYQGAAGAAYAMARCLDPRLPSLSGRLVAVGESSMGRW